MDDVLPRASAVTWAVTLIQHLGSALILNVHFHLLVLDGLRRADVVSAVGQFGGADP